MWLKSTIEFWVELSKELRIWYIFKKTANQYQGNLNREHGLRVDWLGRIYGVVNLPEEVQTASGEIQQAYVLQRITKYGQTMLNMGIGDIVFPEIQKVKNSASYLVILWPAFDTLQIIEIIKGLFKTAFIGTVIYLVIRLATNNLESLLTAWNWFISLFN
jgi:hypothetical protein